MPGVAGGLELERRVLDVEVADQAGLELVEQLGRVSVGEAGVVHDDVGRQGGELGGDGPDVQVVDVVHMRLTEQMGADLVEVGGLGGDLEQDPAGVAQQTPRRMHHQGDDEQRGDGVGPGVARER